MYKYFSDLLVLCMDQSVCFGLEGVAIELHDSGQFPAVSIKAVSLRSCEDVFKGQANWI